MGSGGERPELGKAVRGVKLYADESWLVEYSQRDESILIISTDYHAGPLRLDAARWWKLGQAYGAGAVAAAPEPVTTPAAIDAAAAPAPAPATGGRTPPDLREVLRRDGWSVSLSRRDRTAVFDCASRPGEPLALSRKELYRIAKKMGKRASTR